MSDRKNVTRRDFIRAGVAVGAAATLATRGGHAAEPKPVRVGFVGVGRRGTVLLDTLLQLPGVEIPAVCDIVPEHAARAQDHVEKARGRRPAAYTKGERDYENLVTRDDLDAIVTATPWNWHTPVMVAAMQAGKFAATEVPAAASVEECWQLVDTSEKTGKPCMMLENVCYFQNVLTLLRMVREGCFGELTHAQAGYQHDVRFLLATDDGKLTWRGEVYASRNGNLYPTHPIGPVARWMNINRGDCFTSLTSMSSKPLGAKEYLVEKFGPDHPLAKRDYAHGDINTTMIQTANGRTVTLYYDTCSPRPYDLIFRLQGRKGLYMGSMDEIYLEGVSPQKDKYESFASYQEKYEHPLWRDLQEAAKKNGGHGGGDYITMYEFVKAVRNGTPPPQDVYDAATWSVILPLSEASVAQGGAPMEIPDFTRGKWKTNPPVPIYGA